MSPTGPTTIVVPTRDGAERLATCLAGLADQGADELLVVDDGSREPAAVAAVAAAHGARCVRQAPAGVATARNTGARAARGAFVLFTDDDCAPVAGWAEAMTAALAGGADVVAGPTVAARPERALDGAWHLIADAVTVGSPPFAAGSNFGARAEALAAVPFDPCFDGVGAEDRDWWARVTEAGLDAAYVPGAPVRHAPELGLASFARKHARYGRGAYRFRAAHTAGRVGALGFYGRLVREGARRGPAVGALVLLAQAAAAAGFAAELLSSGAQSSR